MKSIINKIKYQLSILIVSFLFFTPALAQCTNGRIPSPFDPECKNGTPTLGDIAAKFVPLIPILIGLLLFVMILIGAVQVTAAGANEDAKKKGFQTIQNAITGAVLLILSVAIVVAIEAIFGIKLLFGVNVR
jgi:hypothetical protein